MQKIHDRVTQAHMRREQEAQKIVKTLQKTVWKHLFAFFPPVGKSIRQNNVRKKNKRAKMRNGVTQERKKGSKQTSKQTSKQGRKEGGRQAGRQAGRQTDRQVVLTANCLTPRHRQGQHLLLHLLCLAGFIWLADQFISLCHIPSKAGP